ncbi:PP2C family serine/threonine-protein phosphatase [Nocardia abscessus]|uniref:PP2C family serine/threonine-protein phosphatase n=1 Tax=Nocardia abscessus TaxID=120957 RepID=UPI0024571199|nr:PP2C family serine/threonine-protein phosphatase [Nocardia abscessus]
MQLATAQLAAQSGDDRIAATDNSVVVLDGASCFTPQGTAAGTFVDALSNELVHHLHSGHKDLRNALSSAIATTKDQLSLEPGSSPSSTVAIVRFNRHTIETLVLGDSMIVIGENDDSYDVVVDERLAELDLPEARLYQRRLEAGAGYDDKHRAILAQLQRSERAHRNRQGGYWIAEADPAAANHALVAQYPRQDTEWVILATDGAAEPLTTLGISWPQVARMNEVELSALLSLCHQWESTEDPDGQQQPRAKRHDDKTLAVIRLVAD